MNKQIQTHTSMLTFLIARAFDLISEIADKGKWAVFFLPIVAFIERYVFADWEFLIFFAVLVALDTLLGTVFAIQQRCLSPRKYGSVLVKIIVYGSILIFGHIISHIEISDQRIPGGFAFTFLCYAGMVGVEGISILRNAGKINKKLVPLFILKRLEGFNESGDFKELTSNEKD